MGWTISITLMNYNFDPDRYKVGQRKSWGDVATGWKEWCTDSN
jgi:hypothetical protein